MRNAEGPHAYAILALIAFAEPHSSDDPGRRHGPMVLANRRRAFRIALWATLWSVLGGALGYAIGSVFYMRSAIGSCRCSAWRTRWKDFGPHLPAIPG